MRLSMYFAISMALSLIMPASIVLLAFGYGAVHGGTGADNQILFMLALVSLFGGIGLFTLTLELIDSQDKLKEVIYELYQIRTIRNNAKALKEKTTQQMDPIQEITRLREQSEEIAKRLEAQ